MVTVLSAFVGNVAARRMEAPRKLRWPAKSSAGEDHISAGESDVSRDLLW